MRKPREPVEPKSKGVQLLARREHSAAELARKLKARGVSGEDAAKAVAELQEGGWQSDERYAEMLVRTRVNQGYGPVRIEAELRQAGLSGEAVAAALDQAGVDWKQQAAEAQARHFSQLPRTSAERAKQYRYLAGRGFDGSQIQSALKGDGDEGAE